MKSLVLLTTKYAESMADAWLTNEMAYSFRDDGHSMSVVVFSWLRDDPKSSVKEIDGIKVIRIKLFNFFIPPGLSVRLSRFFCFLIGLVLLLSGMLNNVIF